MGRDNALDWTRAIALIGIVAAHTLSNHGSLPFVLGNGIAPIMFGAIMGMTLFVHPATGLQVAVTSVFLFVLGAILETTPTFVVPILMTFGIIYPIAWVIVTKTPWWVGLPLGAIGALSPPLIWRDTPFSQPALVPFGDGGGWLDSLFLRGTYPVVSWWFLPVLGFYLMAVLTKFPVTRIVAVLAAIAGVGWFVYYHYAFGPAWTSLGDVSHMLSPPIGRDIVEWWSVPYGHTGSALSYAIGLAACGGIWSVLSWTGSPDSIIGRNTLSGYTMNVLMATSLSMFGDWTIFFSEMVVITGALMLWCAALKTRRGPIEIVTHWLHRVAGPGPDRDRMDLPGEPGP